MISKVSNRVAKWLAEEGAITGGDKQLFSYAVYSFLFGLSPLFIALGLGLLFNMVEESLLLITPFILIRKFSGGYHLGSAKVCCAISTGVLALALVTIKLIIHSQQFHMLSAVVALSALCVFAFSPIDSKARRLSRKESKIFRFIARVLVSATFLIYILLLLCKLSDVAVPIGVGIVVVAVLQVPCLITILIGKCSGVNTDSSE